MLRRGDKTPSRDGIGFFNSVSFRLLAGLSTVAVLSIASIVAAILTLRVTANSSDDIASSELPYLSAASQLSQNANLVASAAHTLATTKTDFQLRAERNKIDLALNTLDGFLEQVKKHGADAPLSSTATREMLDLVQQRRDELVANINALNKSVQERINKFDQFSRKLLELQSAMNEITGIAVYAARQPDNGYFDAWTKHFDELASETFSLPIWTNAMRVEHSRTLVEGILDAMSGEIRQANGDAGNLLNAKWQPVEVALRGKDNIFDARLALIGLDQSIARYLAEGNFVSRRFISAVSDVYFKAQAEFDRTNRSISSVVDRVSTILAVTGGATIVLIVLLILFVRYSVIDRLTRLKIALQQHFQGEQTEIPTKGNDELAEIGSALAYFVREISEREEGLVQSRQDAEMANSAKSEFLAVVSHELRTPMYGVLAMARFLLESRLDEEQRDYAGSIIRSGETLMTLLNDILDFSKIEAGKLDLEVVEFDLFHEIDEVESLISRSTLPKGLVFNVVIAPAVPRWLVGDAGRMRQVLINLAGNAVKFTEQGEVNISVSTEASSEPDGSGDACVLRFEVTDTGVGISEEKQGLLFQPFSQGDLSTARQYGGTGLGLSISRRLVELMGGTIGLDSRQGGGSTFHFSLPLQLVSRNRIEELTAAAEDKVSATSPIRYKAPDRGTAREAGAVVLVAEDNATNRKIIERLMSGLGYVFEIVENGQEAWEAYCLRDFGLVLTDCRMPVMDGFELAALIRGERRDTLTPIIALTADALQQTKDHCRAVGMDDTLTKPVGVADLDNAISRWLPAAVRLRTPIDVTDVVGRGPDVDELQTKILDLTALRDAFVEVDDDALAFLGRFIESAEAKLQSLIERIDSFDSGKLLHLAHSLKGESYSLGAIRFGRALEAFETDVHGLGGLTDRKSSILAEWKELIEEANRIIGGQVEQVDSPSGRGFASRARKREVN